MNLAKRSDFDYHVHAVGGEPVLVIKDKDHGGMTVTNNIDAVLQSVAVATGLDLTGGKIVYRDSDGYYDGVRLDPDGSTKFYPPAIGRRITDEEEAVTCVRQS